MNTENIIKGMEQYPWSVACICSVIIIMGAIGGIAGGLYNNKCKHKPAIDNWQDWVIFSLSGVVCAFGVVILFACVGNVLNGGDKKLAALYLIGISVLSGFFSMRLLPKLGDQLEQKINDLNAKTLEVEKKTEKNEQKMDAQLKYYRLLSMADTALNTGYDSDMQEAVEHINNNLAFFPIDRQLHVYLGRLYRKQGKLEDAIKILRDFINNLTRAKSTKDFNNGDKEALGTAYFNIACYHCLMAEQNTDTHEKNRLLDEAFIAFKKVEEYNIVLAHAINEDDDMELLYEYKKEYITGKYSKNDKNL